jgi:hypothetical protein
MEVTAILNQLPHRKSPRFRYDVSSHHSHPILLPRHFVNAMPSPFPGMDPYLEHPGMWPEVHHRLISAIGIDNGNAINAGINAI